VRATDGAIATFSAPGGLDGTIGYAINTSGVITGIYLDTNNANYGFIRRANGAITTFSAPGAGAAASQGTISNNLNTAGAIAGYYIDASNVNHGFLLTQ
jgi:hypothetical protein